MLSRFHHCMGIISRALTKEYLAAMLLYLTVRCRDRTSLLHPNRRYSGIPLKLLVQISLPPVSLPNRGLYRSVGLVTPVQDFYARGRAARTMQTSPTSPRHAD